MLNDDCRICLIANEIEDICCNTCKVRLNYALDIAEEVMPTFFYITEDSCQN